MIFSAPRFLVVDDKASHLHAIIRTFHQLGTSCMGIHYDPAEELNEAHFRGVRCLFMDLHLVDGQASTDERRHYALIADILENNINISGGPFVLVVWTEHPHLSMELKNYLDNNLDRVKPHARPLAVLSLAKEQFINVDSGETCNPRELRQAVEQAIASNPQLAALLGWETDVLRAAGDTLASLLQLVPADQKASATPAALDRILSRLASATVGASHVDTNPRAVITRALAPILADRILNQDAPAEVQEVWKKAVTQHEDAKKLGPASDQEAGNINRMLHLAIPGAETLLPTDWGAIVKWPLAWNEEELQRQTGLTIEQMVCGEFGLRSASAAVEPILLRVGAACDYAQNNRGPVPFLFGLAIPESAERQKGKKLSAVIWRSPVFNMPETGKLSRLHVHFRFPQSHLQSACAKWQVLCRLREQILMHLISSASTYVSRPGIVELRMA